jgi:hypothetical protein
VNVDDELFTLRISAVTDDGVPYIPSLNDLSLIAKQKKADFTPRKGKYIYVYIYVHTYVHIYMNIYIYVTDDGILLISSLNDLSLIAKQKKTDFTPRKGKYIYVHIYVHIYMNIYICN